MTTEQSSKVSKNCEFCGEVFVSWRYRNRRFCSEVCDKQWKTQPLATRFQKYVGAQLPNGCIPWTGATASKNHYGAIDVGRGAGRIGAHRVAYELKNGPIPNGLFVLHRCDNPSCVNADHLFLGTQADNIADMVAKGRARKRVPGSRRYLQDLRKRQVERS